MKDKIKNKPVILYAERFAILSGIATITWTRGIVADSETRHNKIEKDAKKAGKPLNYHLVIRSYV